MTRRILQVVLAAFAAWAACCAPAFAVDRFPRPEFDTPYVQPKIAIPVSAAVWTDYLDMTMLAAALAAASWLALRRRSRLGISVLTVLCVAYFGFWRKGCVCPIGSIQNVSQALVDPGYSIPLVVLVFFLLPLGFALFTGRTFCAAVCPLGGVQDLLAIKPVRVPRWLVRALGVVPPLYLGLAVLLAACNAGYLVCRWDPFVGFFRLSAPFHMLVIGAAFVGVGVFVARPYCRFFCPYGVLLGWLSRLSVHHVTITPDECIQCRLCEDACPVDAILYANADRVPVDRGRGIRRLALLLAALPLAAALGAWVGVAVEPALSRNHPDVLLAEQVMAESEQSGTPTTIDSVTFRSSGTPTDDLVRKALAVKRRLRVGSGIFGGFAGLVIVTQLLGLSVARVRKDYVPDRGACVSCSRCFRSCPREQVRLRGGACGNRGATR